MSKSFDPQVSKPSATEITSPGDPSVQLQSEAITWVGQRNTHKPLHNQIWTRISLVIGSSVSDQVGGPKALTKSTSLYPELSR